MTVPEGSQQAYDAEQAAMLALHRRFEDRYTAYFDANPTADWVVFGVETEGIVIGGADDDYPDEEGWAAVEQAAGQELYIFGRPSCIGLDGATPKFD